mmetsp:Transcript_11908/g.34159  ORF Transcript_11908/g.34159 Transcript_11908/m.34159 type:complete len:249 (-) Transcript_11908:862-1608(-)
MRPDDSTDRNPLAGPLAHRAAGQRHQNAAKRRRIGHRCPPGRKALCRRDSLGKKPACSGGGQRRCRQEHHDRNPDQFPAGRRSREQSDLHHETPPRDRERTDLDGIDAPHGIPVHRAGHCRKGQRSRQPPKERGRDRPGILQGHHPDGSRGARKVPQNDDSWGGIRNGGLRADPRQQSPSSYAHDTPPSQSLCELWNSRYYHFHESRWMSRACLQDVEVRSLQAFATPRHRKATFRDPHRGRHCNLHG